MYSESFSKYITQTNDTKFHFFFIFQMHNEPMEAQMETKISPQRVRWGVNDDRPAGITTDTGDFIEWKALKPEIEKRLLNQVRVIPVGSTVETGELNGRKDWIVKILNPQGEEIGHVWFGGDPDNKWAWDGLVRLGYPEKQSDKATIWQVFERFSDGSYRRLENFL
jgi:hypothetical protein